MARNDARDRRTVLRGIGVLTAGVLAGCTGSSGGGSGGNSSGATTTGSAATTGNSTDTGTTGTGSPTGATAGRARVDQWLAEANAYDGSITDETGTNTVEVAVGAGDGGYAFDPAAVGISAGTTVRWTWTGRGGAHNVVAEDGAFNSGQPQVGEDVTYERTFDQPGTYLYYCTPHRRLGMKGAVVVRG